MVVHGGISGPKDGDTPVLTDTAVRNAKPREKPHKLSDSGALYLLHQCERLEALADLRGALVPGERSSLRQHP